MDMSNAAIGGPSRGLLDILFGSSEEKEPVDSGEFSSVAALVKALSGEEAEEDGELFKGRTEQGTSAGKDSSDSRSVIPPVFLPSAMMLGNLQQLQAAAPTTDSRESVQGGGSAKAATNGPLAGALAMDGERQLNQVNQLLQSQGDSKLSAEEQKLFLQVHSKIAGGPQEGFVSPQSLAPALVKSLEGTVDGKAEARSADQANALAQALPSEKAVVPDKANGFLPTQDYMRIRQEAPGNLNADAATKPTALKAEAKVIDLTVGSEGVANAAAAKRGDNAPSGEEESGKQGLGKEGNSPLGLEGNSAVGTRATEFSLVQEMKGEALSPNQRPQILQGIRDGIVTVNQQGGGEMRIILRPEHLGEIRLKVVTGKNGLVDVSIQAEKKEVADLIRGNAADLEVALQDKSLVLSKVDVSVMDGVAATGDAKASSGEQFLGQNGQNQGQARSDQKNESWREQRQSFSESGREAGLQIEPQKTLPRKNSYAASGRDSSGRLDVVA